jgi:regulator of protease activity HflC (stomatin/prohibitin superfamily)
MDVLYIPKTLLLILWVALLVLGVVGAVLRVGTRSRRGKFEVYGADKAGGAPVEPTSRRIMDKPTAAVCLIFAVLAFSAWAFTLGLTQVPAGNVGVVTNFGRVQDQTLDPGMHWVPPFFANVTNVDTRVQQHEMKEIDAASSEKQTIKITGMLNYHVDPRFAAQLYQTVGLDFASKVIDPALNDFVKTVTPDYGIDNVLSHRDEIRSRAIKALGDNLAKYHIVIDDIYISNIAFSDEYQRAIEQKQVAAQQVETEKQVLAQKKIQAEQQQIDAQAQADAAVKIAEGQAKANDLVAKSLNANILQYLMIQKLGDKIQIIYLPTGQNFILDPSALKPLTPSSTPTP